MKVAIITGAGRGIGRATALEFASHGVNSVLVSRSSEELKSVALEIQQKYGLESIVFPCDVANEDSVIELFDQVESQWGRIDYLVNNAATFSAGLLIDLPLETWQNLMRINVNGVFLFTREAFRFWKSAKQGGSVVNISSLSGIRATQKFPGFSAYTTSKFAVVGMTEAFAAEAVELGARVNCIAPGAVNTKMLRDAAPHLKTQTEPDDIAKTIWYLSDPTQSGHMNGSIVEIFCNVS